jgi:hypothetical protein
MDKQELLTEIRSAVQKHDLVEFRELNLLLIKIYDYLHDIEIKTIPQYNTKAYTNGKKK